MMGGVLFRGSVSRMEPASGMVFVQSVVQVSRLDEVWIIYAPPAVPLSTKLQAPLLMRIPLKRAAAPTSEMPGPLADFAR